MSVSLRYLFMGRGGHTGGQLKDCLLLWHGQLAADSTLKYFSYLTWGYCSVLKFDYATEQMEVCYKGLHS